jgi:hypothetical protein
MRTVAARVVLLFALATAVNYPWELAQTPLYVGVTFPVAVWHCFVSSLGDGLLVLFIFVALAIVMRSLDWYSRLTAQSYLVLAAAGLVVGFATEWWGLQIARRWQYSELMPVIPGTVIGVVPVLQMLLLPPAIFWVLRRLAKRGVGGLTSEH